MSLQPVAMGAPRLRQNKMRTKLFSGSSPQLSSHQLSLGKLRSLGAWYQDFPRSQKWNQNQALIEERVGNGVSKLTRV